MKYMRHPSAEQRLSSARALVKALLADMPGVDEAHRRECIRQIGLYKITEADCSHKFRTRYMSEAALTIAQSEIKPNDSKQLVHEHVIKRSIITDKLLAIKGSNVDNILDEVLACTVTKEEHRELELSKRKGLQGWERYKDVPIHVWDTEMGSRLF
jgi:hypothetical protein